MLQTPPLCWHVAHRLGWVEHLQLLTPALPRRWLSVPRGPHALPCGSWDVASKMLSQDQHCLTHPVCLRVWQCSARCPLSQGHTPGWPTSWLHWHAHCLPQSHCDAGLVARYHILIYKGPAEQSQSRSPWASRSQPSLRALFWLQKLLSILPAPSCLAPTGCAWPWSLLVLLPEASPSPGSAFLTCPWFPRPNPQLLS